MLLFYHSKPPMHYNKKAESFIGIMVWVFLLSIVILGIANLLSYSQSIISDYENNTKINILRNNISNILKEIDTSEIQEGQLFYITKDLSTQTYWWTGSDNAKYIDDFWNNIDDINSFAGNIYSRQVWIEREDTSLWEQNQVLRVSVRKLIKK